MSDVIQEAKARRAKLQQEIDVIDQYLKLHRQIFGAEASENLAFGDRVEVEMVSAVSREKVAPLNDPIAIANDVEAILATASEPMTRGQLRTALASRGVIINSKDANKYLGTILWRNRHRFVNVEGQGYWPIGRDLPPWLTQKDPLFQ